MIDAIHSGTLADAATNPDPDFGVRIPKECPGVPSEILTPRLTWQDQQSYDVTAKNLAGLIRENFKRYEANATNEVRAAGPNG